MKTLVSQILHYIRIDSWHFCHDFNGCLAPLALGPWPLGPFHPRRRPLRECNCSSQARVGTGIWVTHGFTTIHHSWCLFPECVARVPVSLWGCGGWAMFAGRCVYVRNRPQASAWGPYGRAYGKFCQRGHFWRFPALRNFILRGRRGTSWHFNIFHDVSRVDSCAAQYFATFSEDALHFTRQAQHFGDFRRVVFRVFLRIAMSGLRKMLTRCEFVNFVTCDENWWSPHTKCPS